MTDGSIRHQQCTLNMLWQVICLQARNNPFSNARISHWTCCLDNKIIDNKAVSFASANTDHIQIPEGLRLPLLLKDGAHWCGYTPNMDWEMCVAQDNGWELLPGNAADAMSASSRVTPGHPSARAQLPITPAAAFWNVHSQGKEQRTGRGTFFKPFGVNNSPEASAKPCARNEPQSLKDDHSKNFLAL